MIYNYPYFGFQNYSSYAKKNNYMPNYNVQHNIKPFNKSNHINSIENNIKKTNNYSNGQKHSKDSSIEEISKDNSPLINIFGISLCFDDILLICLIFFLYNEKVDDSYLMLSLILLLLS